VLTRLFRPRAVRTTEPVVLDDVTADPQLRALVEGISRRFGERIDAIFLYGSWRRGRRDTMPDFYVLLDRYPKGWRYWLGRVLPPTVLVQKSAALRAKVTILTTAQLLDAVNSDFHPYFRARFAQPTPLVYARNTTLQALACDICALAQRRLMETVGRCWPSGSLPASAMFWQHTFRLTYGAELRSESAAKIAELYLADIAYYDALYAAFMGVHAEARQSSWWANLSWRCRQLVGKVFSGLRIIKSALTFDDPLDYLAWKVGRQSGVLLEPSDRARRWPLVFGWGYVWRLYRLGGFR